jgi:hypothetical protein
MITVGLKARRQTLRFKIETEIHGENRDDKI